MNDNAMAHFKKILQQRKRQISLDTFLVQKDSQLAAKKQRQETPETNDSEKQTKWQIPHDRFLGKKDGLNLFLFYI